MHCRKDIQGWTHSRRSPPVFPATKGRPLLGQRHPQPALAPVRRLPDRTGPAQHTPCTLGPSSSGFLTAAAPQGPATPSWQGTALPLGTICNGGASLLPRSRAMAGGAQRAVSCPPPNELQTRPLPQGFLQGMSTETCSVDTSSNPRPALPTHFHPGDIKLRASHFQASFLRFYLKKKRKTHLDDMSSAFLGMRINRFTNKIYT